MLTAAQSATDGGTVTQRVTFSYDAFGSRIQRQGWDGTTTTTERYGLDGWDTAKPSPVGNENFDAWVEMDGGNTLTLRRISGVGFDENVARQTAGGTVNWYLNDHQRSVRAVIDNSGSIVNMTTFSSTGVIVAGTLFDRMGYTGQSHDSITGFVSMGEGTREYDAATSRFLSEDPKGFAAGDANLYRYVGNSPTNATDPSGREIVAVGAGARDEAIWQLENTFKLSRDDIEVVALGPGSFGVWENTDGEPMYLIRPRPWAERPRNVVKPGRPLSVDAIRNGKEMTIWGRQAEIGAIQDLYDAFWNPDIVKVVAQLRPDAKDPQGRPLPGKWHERDLVGGKQFYIGTAVDRSILTAKQLRWLWEFEFNENPKLVNQAMRLRLALARAEYRRLNPTGLDVLNGLGQPGGMDLLLRHLGRQIDEIVRDLGKQLPYAFFMLSVGGEAGVGFATLPFGLPFILHAIDRAGCAVASPPGDRQPSNTADLGNWFLQQFGGKLTREQLLFLDDLAGDVGSLYWGFGYSLFKLGGIASNGGRLVFSTEISGSSAAQATLAQRLEYYAKYSKLLEALKKAGPNGMTLQQAEKYLPGISALEKDALWTVVGQMANGKPRSFLVRFFLGWWWVRVAHKVWRGR